LESLSRGAVADANAADVIQGIDATAADFLAGVNYLDHVSLVVIALRRSSTSMPRLLVCCVGAGP